MHKKCKHGRRRYDCKDCGGSGICEHGRRRSNCKECGGTGICEHGRRRTRCEECGGHVVVTLDATAVEESDASEGGEEEPHERAVTVQARMVVRPPRGAKRKRLT